jgi:signal transduction histidine kinase
MIKDTLQGKAFPRNLFLLAVAAVCLGLASSALYSYFTLARLREEYLANRGREIAALLDGQLRGPSRRNPESWQEIFANMLQDRPDMLAFLALVDQENRILASAGVSFRSVFTAATGFQESSRKQIYILEIPVMSPQRGGQGMGMPMGAHAVGWSIRVGMHAAAADFIRRQALVQLGVNAVAIAALAALAFYFLHVLGRFLYLKGREESDRHLASLGTMSATLAHEIRNPLGAMKGLTQLAQEELPKDHQAQALMQTVVSEAERLERLVSGLLNFARRRESEMKTFDYAELLRQVGESLRPQLEAAGVGLDLPADNRSLSLSADEDGLRQVLMNVLLNAVEASPAGGKVSIVLHPDRNLKLLRTEIEDRGSGLGERDPEELFEPFITTKTRGTGLGLAVSRQILESMGGRITLANRPGGGTRCVVDVPWEMT